MNEHRLNVALVFFLVRLHRLFYENAINFIYWNVMLFYANELCGWAFQWHKAASRNHPTSLPPIYFWLRTDVAISKVCTSMYWYTFEVHKRLVWLAGWPVRVICKNVTLPIRQGFFFVLGSVCRIEEAAVVAADAFGATFLWIPVAMYIWNMCIWE